MNKNGSYVISEQGDLGLGLTPVNEAEIKKDLRDKEKESKEDKPKMFGID